MTERLATGSAKLQIKPGRAVSVLRQPEGVDLELPASCPAAAEAVFLFRRATRREPSPRPAS